jgi:uncharacterized membrane protein
MNPASRGADATAAERPAARSPRLLYIDWLRGLAVLIMIFWHAMDAWTAPWARGGTSFAIVIVLGGWAAPLFLFLAGVSVPLAGEASIRRSPGPSGPGALARAHAGWRLQKRGWQVFGLAHVFRLQSFLLNPTASWSSLLKPDILNILGLGLVAVAFCWSRATTRLREGFWLLLPGAAIVLLAPASRLWSWPALLRPYAPRLEAYIRPVSGMGVFSVFPWLAFVFVGAFVGSRMVRARGRGDDALFQRRLASSSLGVVLAGLVGMYLPSLTSSSFWTTSLSFFLIRTGAMTLGLTVAWLWLRRPTAARYSPMIVMGRASLFVYWVHVELAYGFFSYPLHYALPLPWALAAFGVFTAFMLGLTVLWNRRRRPMVPAHLTPIDTTSHHPDIASIPA